MLLAMDVLSTQVTIYPNVLKSSLTPSSMHSFFVAVNSIGDSGYLSSFRHDGSSIVFRTKACGKIHQTPYNMQAFPILPVDNKPRKFNSGLLCMSLLSLQTCQSFGYRAPKNSRWAYKRSGKKKHPRHCLLSLTIVLLSYLCYSHASTHSASIEESSSRNRRTDLKLLRDIHKPKLLI
jgi:hypothetical protein